MPEKYKGIIIEESLEDNRAINNLEVIKIRISSALRREDRWHLYTILVLEKDIKELTRQIKQGWYAHFWQGSKVVVIFQGKRFAFDHNNREACKPAVEYGLSLGIPKEQLDFPIE